VALAAVDLLGGVVAAAGLGTVSAARTDWESMIAALGVGWRPAARRAWVRRRSCSMAVAPLAFQRQ
jgi:hypothetical protein